MTIVIRPMRKEDLPEAAGLEEICLAGEAWSEKVYHEEFARSANARPRQECPGAGSMPAGTPGSPAKECHCESGSPPSPDGERIRMLPEEAYLWLWAAADAARPGRLVGTISLTRAGEDGEIGNVAVLPACRRQGIARRLLETALRFGEEELGLAAFTLEVRAGNEAAIRLYEAAGFRAEGRRPRFYTEPAEDALIMWRR